MKIHTFYNRSPRDYRSLGIMLDTNRREHTLTISLWVWDVEITAEQIRKGDEGT